MVVLINIDENTQYVNPRRLKVTSDETAFFI